MPRDTSGDFAYVPSTTAPAVEGTIIDETDFNDMMDDIATELQDSLSRSGKGGMLVPFEFAKGTSGAPGITFVGDNDTGINSEAANEVDIVTDGTVIVNVATTGATVTGTLSVDGGIDLLSTTSGLITSYVTDDPTAIALAVTTDIELTETGARLESLANNGVEKWAVDKDGTLIVGTIPSARVTGMPGGATTGMLQFASNGSFYDAKLWSDTIEFIGTGAGKFITSNGHDGCLRLKIPCVNNESFPCITSTFFKTETITVHDPTLDANFDLTSVGGAPNHLYPVNYAFHAEGYWAVDVIIADGMNQTWACNSAGGEVSGFTCTFNVTLVELTEQAN